jgi:hypothetical protein
MSKCSLCQVVPKTESISPRQTKDIIEKGFKRSHVSLEIGTAMVPKARITRTEGNYRLQSTLQLAYDGGINYIYNVNEHLLISSGFHVVLGERNFFSHVPSEDVRRYRVRGHNIIYNKALWGAMRIPLLVEKKIHTKEAGLISLKGGLNVRYSGFVSDLVMEGGGIMDSTNIYTPIFSAFFAGNNDKKPWITVLAGTSKLFVLDNKNILSIGLQADISATYFFKGNYKIMIPDKPVTSGTYKINGTSLGLSVQYILTGANKRLIRSYQKNMSY